MIVRSFIIAAVLASTAATAQVTPGRDISVPLPPATFESMQWLYGSGEAAAVSRQAYVAFRNHAVAAARSRPRDSVVLAQDATLEHPTWIPCADRPLAVVLDVDETVLQNLGYEFDRLVRGYGYQRDSWSRWEQTGYDRVTPMPGVAAALAAIRQANITVIFNSNRTVANAEYTERALNDSGVGPARHGDTLYLLGDIAPGSDKDARRRAISERFCVVAMAGDQLGDFSDLFNHGVAVPARRNAADTGPFADLWGNGWFMLSNPVYGPSIAGTRDQVFSNPDKRWLDPEGAPVQ